MTEEIDMFPSAGIISVAKLAKYLKTDDATLIKGLTRLRIPYIKLSGRHKHWLIRLEDLKPINNE